MKKSRIHILYDMAFAALRDKARVVGTTLKEVAKSDNYSGKVLRRGTPGAFGYDLRPRKSAKTDHAGYPCGGNSRQRRFARRHPQHFTKVVA